MGLVLTYPIDLNKLGRYERNLKPKINNGDVNYYSSIKDIETPGLNVKGRSRNEK